MATSADEFVRVAGLPKGLTTEYDYIILSFMKIQLSPTEQAQILRTKPEEGNRGGFQQFMVRLQRKLGDDGSLELSWEDIQTIDRYSGYDQGGYEGRLREAFGRHLPDLFPKFTPSLF